MFDWLPKPKSEKSAGFLLISALAAIALVGYYIFSTIDLVPDGIGPFGYLDDLIMFLLIMFFIRKLYDRLFGKSNRGAWSAQLAKTSLWEMVFTMKFWAALLLIAGAIAYVVWVFDVIPDSFPVWGFVDDAGLVITAAIGLIKFYSRSGRR